MWGGCREEGVYIEYVYVARAIVRFLVAVLRYIPRMRTERVSIPIKARWWLFILIYIVMTSNYFYYF